MKALILSLFLVGCATLPQTNSVAPAPAPESELQQPAPVLPAPGCDKILAAAEKTCPKPGEYQALDVAGPVTTKLYAIARCLGVKTIIRYGDYPNETIRGKTPKAAERASTQAQGFSEMFVFQHNNRWERSDGSLYGTFNAARGKADALRMLELYTEVPAWYYGVDFDTLPGVQMAAVKAYAAAFKAVADLHGKKVGAYGSGYALDQLLSAGLIHYAWLSMSTGFMGTKTFTASGRWNLLQVKDRMCGGMSVDFDKVNPAKPEFGAYRK